MVDVGEMEIEHPKKTKTLLLSPAEMSQPEITTQR